MVDRLTEKTDRLLYKHGEQLLSLENETSKLYGVNFKYVDVKDLGVPLDFILQLRKDLKIKPK